MSRLAEVRERLAVIPGRHRPRNVRNGILGLILVSILAVFGAYYSFAGYPPLLPRGGDLVRADVSSAFDVNTDTPVRIGGIDVGRVAGIGLGDGGRYAVVTMRVDSQDADTLRADASAAIRERLILGGNMFIALAPGSSATPLGGATIPLSRTSVQVDLDQILDTFTAPVRRGLRSTLSGLRAAFASPAPVRGTVDELAPSLGVLGPAVDALRGERPGDLPRMITGFSRVVGGLDVAESSLGDLIDSAAATFAVTAARSADLGATLDRAPGALDTTRVQLSGLDRTIDLINPLASALLPGAGRVQSTLLTLEPALSDTRVLLDRARPLVNALQPAARGLEGAAAQGVPLIKSITPSLSRINTNLMPFLDKTDPQTGLRMYELPGPTLAAVDSLAGLYDSAGHVAAFDGGVGPQALHDYTPCDIFLNDPSVQLLTCENILQYIDTLFGGPAPSASAQHSLLDLLERRR